MPPGSYRVTLEFDGIEESRTVSVLPDPRAAYTPAEREQNYRALVALQSLQEAAVSAVERIRRLRRRNEKQCEPAV